MRPWLSFTLGAVVAMGTVLTMLDLAARRPVRRLRSRAWWA